MLIDGYFDGCCEPRNPYGHASFGVTLKVDGKYAFSKGGYVGYGYGMSNNVAEYSGVLCLLDKLASMRPFPNAPKISLYGDSKLVIMQMSGKWQSHGGIYAPYMDKAKAALFALQTPIQFVWIPRVQNHECDALSKSVLRERQVKSQIQMEAA